MRAFSTGEPAVLSGQLTLPFAPIDARPIAHADRRPYYEYDPILT